MGYRNLLRRVGQRNDRRTRRLTAAVQRTCGAAFEPLEDRRLFSAGISPSASGLASVVNGPGFGAHYFANSQYKGSPVFETVDTDLSDNNFGAGSPDASVPADGFSAIYTAKLKPVTSGSYLFDITADDDGELYLSGGDLNQDLISDEQNDGVVTLEAGTTYTLTYLAREVQGGANFSLQWVPPDSDGTPIAIPANLVTSQLDPVTAAPTDFTSADVTALSTRFTFTDNSDNEVKFQLERAPVANGVVGAYSVVGEATLNSTEIFDNTVSADTTYSYRVRAFNFEGSAASSPVQITTPARSLTTGATGAWYDTGFWGLSARPNQAGLGVFTTPRYREEVSTVDFPDPTLNRTEQGVPGDDFSTSFTGKIVIPEGQGGTYTFVSSTDDDGALFVNGQLVSYDPGGHGQRDATNLTPLTLEPGAYNFVLLQAEQGGGAAATLKWQGPATDNTRVVIPDTNLLPLADIPTAPTAGAPDSTSASSATISIADTATSELRYEIDQSTDPAFGTIQRTLTAPINASKVTVLGLTPDTDYYFRIRAVNLEGSSAPLVAPVRTAAAGVVPAAPTNLTARTTSPSHVVLTFTDNSNNEQSFDVYRRQGSGEFVKIASLDPNTTRFEDEAPGLNASFTYRVVAHSSEGDSAPADINVISGAPGGTGLLATAYANTTFTDNPNDPADTRVYVDPQVNRNYGEGSPIANIPADNFSIKWTGSVQAEKSEAYTFQVEGDDQTSLTVSDAQGNVLATLALAPGVKTTPAINLVAGQKYNIEVRLVETTGNASAFLRWQSPTTPLEAIPQAFLFATPAATASQISDVYVRGSSWSANFLNFLTTQPNQNSNLGYRITGFDESSPILSFTNLDTILIKFSGPVPAGLTPSAVSVTGSNGQTYTVQSVATAANDPNLAVIRLATPLLNSRARVQLTNVDFGSVQKTLLSENFNNVPLQDSVDEHDAQGNIVPNAWSPTIPGWDVDRSQMPGIEDQSTDGVTEWAGFAAASNKFWGVNTDNQRRQEFTKANGNVLVADPDEWDDGPHPLGLYTSFATAPTVDVSNVLPGTLKIAFDSAWRPEADDDSELPNNQTAHVAVSFDGGATYEDVLTWTSRESESTYHPDSLNESVSLDVIVPEGATQMKVRFGLTDAENDWFWAVDNVSVSGSVVRRPELRLNVLPADVNQSGGAVNATDLVLTRNRVGRTIVNQGTGSTAYSIFNDLNGDGVINASDLVLARNRIGQALPAAPTLRSLFSPTQIASGDRDRDILADLG